MNLFSYLPDKMDRGVNWRRLRVFLKDPLVLFKNIRFHWVRTVSEQRHIFVVGPPRNGTTLIKNLVRGHPNVVGIDGETFFFLRYNYTDFSVPSVAPARMEELVGEARDSVHLFDLFVQEAVDNFPQKRFVEKTPEHASRLDFILKYFPRAQVVFMVRDVRDGYLSALRNPGYHTNLESTGSAVQSYAEVWKTCIEGLLRHQDNPAVLPIRYEDLCANPEGELRTVMEFLGESFEPGQLDPERYSNTYKSQKRQQKRLNERITTKTVGEYRSAMSPNNIRTFQDLVGRELKAMGYELL